MGLRSCCNKHFINYIVEKQSNVLPMVDRSLQELATTEKEHDCRDAGNEIKVNSGEDGDLEMTLKQLKHKSKTKKRKRVNSVSTCTKQICVKLEPEEEDFDLEKPIVSLKSKLPKAKRKLFRISSNFEEDLDDEMQQNLDLAEVPEPDVAPLVDDPEVINLKETKLTDIIPLEGDNATPLSFSGDGICVLNQISYDVFDNVEPSFQTDPSYINNNFQHFLDFSTSELEKHDNTELSLVLYSPPMNQSHVAEVPDLRANNCTNSKDFYDGYDSCLLETSIDATFSPDQQLKDPTFPSSGLKVDTNEANYELDTANSLVLHKGEYSLNEQRYINVAEERNTSANNTNNEYVSSQTSTPLPEKLLSTRKVISPNSRERISLDMNSKALDDDKVFPVAETPKTKSPSILKKVTNGKRRNSLPKGNLEGSRLSRSLQNFSTGCSSLAKCSESAIAFSKRQMQDIEAIAINLMGELNSMKTVMQGKFLSETHQISDLKREAEEVKEAIKNATKTEETTRKWLSMMSRDNTRFCRIMSMKVSESVDDVVDEAVNNVALRERKKIAFADEAAGGMLCHVKYFENDMKLKSDITQED